MAGWKEIVQREGVAVTEDRMVLVQTHNGTFQVRHIQKPRQSGLTSEQIDEQLRTWGISPDAGWH